MRGFNFLRTVALAGGALFLAGALGAHDSDGWRRRGRDVYRDDGYYDPAYRQPSGGYGYGYGSPEAQVNRVAGDLNAIASRTYADGHERKHFDEAQKNLYKFQDSWRSGRFDTKPLDKAIESMQHLASADQLRPRDRDIIASDMNLLRELRANRSGGAYSPYGNGRYDPYGNGRYDPYGGSRYPYPYGR